MTRLTKVKARVSRRQRGQKGLRFISYEEKVPGARLLVTASNKTLMESSLKGLNFECCEVKLKVEAGRLPLYGTGAHSLIERNMENK